MKKLKIIICLFVVCCMCSPFFYGCNSNKITISFSHITENAHIEVASLPNEEEIKIEKNSLFSGLEEQGNLVPVEYRVYTTETEFYNIYPHQNLTQNINVVVVWDSKTNVSYADLDAVLAKIQKLENISITYNNEMASTKDPMLRVLQYIRQVRYNGFAWNIVAGSLESDFNQYVLEHQSSGENLQSLQILSTITNPKTNQEVDFVHLIVALNVIVNCNFESSANIDLASWGGDLCQLAIELKHKNVSGVELQNEANKLFNNQTSSFSSYDLLADIDAYNIANLYYLIETHTISGAIEQYYKLSNSNNNKSNFLKLAFPQSNSVSQSNIKSRLDNNILLGVWCESQGETYNNLTDELNACINEFIKYFIG